MRHGTATLTCDITADCLTDDGALLTVDGSAAFGDAVLACVRRLRYLPALRNGVPAVEPRRRYTISVDPTSPPP